MAPHKHSSLQYPVHNMGVRIQSILHVHAALCFVTAFPCLSGSYRCKSSNSILFVPLDGEGSALWKTVNTSLRVAKEHCEARSMRLPLLDKWFDTQCVLEYSKRLEIATGVVLPKLLVSADQCTSTVSNVHVYTTRIQSGEVESAQYTGRYFCLLPGKWALARKSDLISRILLLVCASIIRILINNNLL